MKPFEQPICSKLPAATSTRLQTPTGVYKDNATGNIYVADTYGHRIRRFLEGGTVTTVAGSGSAGYAGDGGPATTGQLDSPYNSCLKST